MSRVEEIARRLARVRAEIAGAAVCAGREARHVRLIAVTKYAELDDVRAAVAAGQLDFGENYVQEARRKIEVLSDARVRWHFIGRLQSNKAARALHLFHLIHTLASRSALEELAKACARTRRHCRVLVQIRLSRERERPGVDPEEAERLVREACRATGIRVDGVMGIAPLGVPARPYFALLRETAERLRALGLEHAPMHEISAGMSDDFRDAIAEGATLVRLGRAIFGRQSER